MLCGMPSSVLLLVICAVATALPPFIPRERKCDRCELEIRQRLGSVYKKGRPFDLVRLSNPAAFDEVMLGETIFQVSGGSFRQFCSVMKESFEFCEPVCLAEPAFGSSLRKTNEFCEKHSEVFKDSRTPNCLMMIQPRWKQVCMTLSVLAHKLDLPTGVVIEKNATAADYKKYQKYCQDVQALVRCERRLLTANVSEMFCSQDTMDAIFRWRYAYIEDNVRQLTQNLNNDSPKVCVDVLQDAKEYLSNRTRELLERTRRARMQTTEATTSSTTAMTTTAASSTKAQDHTSFAVEATTEENEENENEPRETSVATTTNESTTTPPESKPEVQPDSDQISTTIEPNEQTKEQGSSNSGPTTEATTTAAEELPEKGSAKHSAHTQMDPYSSGGVQQMVGMSVMLGILVLWFA